MTTTIKVTSHNYPARVETFDGGVRQYAEIITPEDGEKIYHCTTSRELRITDLEYDDPAVVEHKAKTAK
jgi:hypothetical protein